MLTLTSEATRVLDVGGGYAPLNTATHVIDVLSYEQYNGPLVSGQPVRFDRSSWVQADICVQPWPFGDGYFDYSFCSHTLEDVRDPIAVCRELMRTSKAGYIETPSRLREIFHPKGGYFFRRLIGRPLRVGYGHHRWFAEMEGNSVIFTAKTLTSIASPDFFITRHELGRNLSSEESVVSLFWTDRFDVTEQILVNPGETEAELAAFKRKALARLRGSRPTESAPRKP